MDYPLFTSLSGIVWTLLTFWLVWFGFGFAASAAVLWYALRRRPDEEGRKQSPTVASDSPRNG